jgi:hypothetical protein
MDEKIVTFGNSVAWHRSWFLYTHPEGLPFHWRIIDVVIFGYGFRLKRLHYAKVHGMLPNDFKISVYWNWRPAESWVKLYRRVSE